MGLQIAASAPPPVFVRGLLWPPWNNLGREERGAHSLGSETVQTLARPSLQECSDSTAFYSIWQRCLPWPSQGGVGRALCQKQSTKRVPGLKVTARPQGLALPTRRGFRGRAGSGLATRPLQHGLPRLCLRCPEAPRLSSSDPARPDLSTGKAQQPQGSCRCQSSPEQEVSLAAPAIPSGTAALTSAQFLASVSLTTVLTPAGGL